jgi:hypothetical protein
MKRMFGHEVVIFGVDPVTFQMTHRIKKSIRKSAVGPYTMPIARININVTQGPPGSNKVTSRLGLGIWMMSGVLFPLRDQLCSRSSE